MSGICWNQHGFPWKHDRRGSLAPIGRSRRKPLSSRPYHFDTRPKPPMPRAKLPRESLTTLLDPERMTETLQWEELFGNSKPVELEIGSGKGLFLANAA